MRRWHRRGPPIGGPRPSVADGSRPHGRPSGTRPVRPRSAAPVGGSPGRPRPSTDGPDRVRADRYAGHGTSCTALRSRPSWSLVTLGSLRPRRPRPRTPLAEARRRLARDDGAAADRLLEEALPTPGPDRDAVLDLLRQAYDVAANQAEAGGRPREAETTARTSKILNRSRDRPGRRRPGRRADPHARAAAPRPSPLPKPRRRRPGGADPARDEPAARRRQRTRPGPARSRPAAPPTAPAGDHGTSRRCRPEPPAVDLADRPTRPSRPRITTRPGGSMPTLDRRSGCPPCGAITGPIAGRSEVVHRINARPADRGEWAEHRRRDRPDPGPEPEQLARRIPPQPGRRSVRSARKKPSPAKTVVRGSSPEEPAAVDRPVRAASIPAPAEPAAPTQPPRPGRRARPDRRDRRRPLADPRDGQLPDLPRRPRARRQGRRRSPRRPGASRPGGGPTAPRDRLAAPVRDLPLPDRRQYSPR